MMKTSSKVGHPALEGIAVEGTGSKAIRLAAFMLWASAMLALAPRVEAALPSSPALSLAAVRSMTPDAVPNAFLFRPGGFDYAGRTQAAGQAGFDVVDTVLATPNLESFAVALQIAGMTEFLRQASNVHLFAPSDEAFDRMSPADRHALFSDRSALLEMLSRHVRLGSRAGAVLDQPTPAGSNGFPTRRTGTQVALLAGGKASNGTVHVIDKVFMSD